MRAHGSTTISDLATEAGAGSDLIDYLEERGIKAPATLALLARDEPEFETILLQPLMTGWKKRNGDTITVNDAEKPIARAILKHMWNLARTTWTAQQAAMSSMIPSTPPPSTGTSAGTTATKDDFTSRSVVDRHPAL